MAPKRICRGTERAQFNLFAAMIIYKDKLSGALWACTHVAAWRACAGRSHTGDDAGDEMFADSYPMREVEDGFFFEVDGSVRPARPASAGLLACRCADNRVAWVLARQGGADSLPVSVPCCRRVARLASAAVQLRQPHLVKAVEPLLCPPIALGSRAVGEQSSEGATAAEVTRVWRAVANAGRRARGHGRQRVGGGGRGEDGRHRPQGGGHHRVLPAHGALAWPASFVRRLACLACCWLVPIATGFFPCCF